MRKPRTKANGWLLPLLLLDLEPEVADDLVPTVGEALLAVAQGLAEEEEDAAPEGKGGKTVSRCGCEKV